MNKKLFSAAQIDLILDWCERWLELIGLINEVTGTADPPTDLDELRYQRLRRWFFERQEQFMTIWEYFCRCRQEMMNTECNSSLVDSFHIIDCYDNPFSCLYEADNLYALAVQLDLQSSTYIWEPSEHRAGVIRPLLVKTGEVIMELAHWINE